MKKLVPFCLLIFLVTGCLYPNEKRIENQVPYQKQILTVEEAILQYRLDNQSIPVRYREQETNPFEQHLVDFQKLIPNYLQQAPGNSFENGGVYQYVLVDVEKDLKVKLIDLTIMRKIQEFQRTVNEYRRKNRFAPVKEIVTHGVYLLDHEKLNLKESPTVKSPYHPDHRLPLLMDENGKVIVDYTIDLNDALNKFKHQFMQGDDIRTVLIENYPFVPAHSLRYSIENGKAVFNN